MIDVRVSDRPEHRGVAIYVMRPAGDDTYMVLRPSDLGAWAWDPVAANVEPGSPTLLLTDDIARPLLDALLRHYAGAEDTRTLRRDYDAERARVDGLIETIKSSLFTPADIRLLLGGDE